MRLRFIITGGYLGLAIYAWVDFLWLPKDGLANLGLMFVAFPVTVVGLILTEVTGGGSFILMSTGFGYYVDHALYFWPSVIVTALMLYWISAAFERIWDRAKRRAD